MDTSVSGGLHGVGHDAATCSAFRKSAKVATAELPATAISKCEGAHHAVVQWFTTFFGVVITINAAAIKDTAIQYRPISVLSVVSLIQPTT
jgi:hypothetical protein